MAAARSPSGAAAERGGAAWSRRSERGGGGGRGETEDPGRRREEEERVDCVKVATAAAVAWEESAMDCGEGCGWARVGRRAW